MKITPIDFNDPTFNDFVVKNSRLFALWCKDEELGADYWQEWVGLVNNTIRQKHPQKVVLLKEVKEVATCFIEFMLVYKGLGAPYEMIEMQISNAESFDSFAHPFINEERWKKLVGLHSKVAQRHVVRNCLYIFSGLEGGQKALLDDTEELRAMWEKRCFSDVLNQKEEKGLKVKSKSL